MTETCVRHLPSMWASSTLGDLVEVLRGVSYKKEDATGTPGPGLVPILRATNIDGDLNFDNLVFVPHKYVSADQLLKPGDIVVAASSGSRSVVGKAAMLKSQWLGSFGAFCYALRPANGVEARFLAYFLQTDEYRNQVSELSAGVNINNLRRAHIQGIPVRLAPLIEEGRIVAEIEKQFTRLDAAVAALKRVQANLKRYRAAVLKAAVEGHLVPTEAELARQEGRSFEPARELLQRLAHPSISPTTPGFAPKKSKTHGGIATPPDTAYPPQLPEGWTWTTLDQLTCLITSGSRGWAQYYSDSGPLFIRAQDIKTDKLDLGAVAHVLLPARMEGARTLVSRLDILVTITGANVTKTAIVRESLGEAYVSQHVALVRPADSSLSEYAYYWIICPSYGRRELECQAYGAGKPGLNLDNLRELPIGVPPLLEQHRIVTGIERRLSVTNELEIQVGANLKRAERLRQAILKHAFEGRLVPQDPNDEPASALLERIRAELDAKRQATPVARQPRLGERRRKSRARLNKRS